MKRLLRLLGALAWLGVLGVACVAVAYASFNLVVHRGAVATPDVAGVPLREAADRLQDLGLRVRNDPTTSQPDPRIPKGAVIEQRPPAGARVKRGGLIDLIISTGPESATVPDVVGTEVQAALVSLVAAGLEAGATLRVASIDLPAGRVVETIPPAGAAASRGAAISLVVSEGARAETWVMPALISLPYDRARAALERGGFRFGRVTFEAYEGIAPGTILRQFPLAGHPVSRSDAISLAVAADPAGTLGL